MKAQSKTKAKIIYLTTASIIAALYVILTLLSGLLGLDGKGIIQVRISEALCILPIFTSAAIPGVTVGCFIYNLFFCSPIDAIFGTLATLIGVLAARFITFFRKNALLASIPTVISNAVIIPFIIAFVYNGGGLAGVPFLMLTVFIGEAISCTAFGYILAAALKKHQGLFKLEK